MEGLAGAGLQGAVEPGYVAVFEPVSLLARPLSKSNEK